MTSPGCRPCEEVLPMYRTVRPPDDTFLLQWKKFHLGPGQFFCFKVAESGCEREALRNDVVFNPWGWNGRTSWYLKPLGTVTQPVKTSVDQESPPPGLAALSLQ